MALRLREEKKETPPPKPEVDEKQEELQLGGEPEKEEVVVVEEKPKEDEATLRLQKQIDDLKKSEELQRNYAAQAMREREEAIRLARESAVQLEQIRRESEEQEEVAVGSALAAAKAEADKAQSDYVTALNAGDNAAAAEAQRRMSRAEARIDRLEIGQQEIEARKKTPKPEEKPVRAIPQTGDPVDSYNLPDDCKTWLKTHREFLTDPRKAIELDRADRLARLKGLGPGNPQYLPEIEKEVFPAKAESEQEQPANERASIMSAPVSREAPSGGGQRSSRTIRLTAEQREAAKLAGISEVEYAKQLQKLNELKGEGNYSERRYG